MYKAYHLAFVTVVFFPIYLFLFCTSKKLNTDFTISISCNHVLKIRKRKEKSNTSVSTVFSDIRW